MHLLPPGCRLLGGSQLTLELLHLLPPLPVGLHMPDLSKVRVRGGGGGANRVYWQEIQLSTPSLSRQS